MKSGRTNGRSHSPGAMYEPTTRARHHNSIVAAGILRSPASHCCHVRSPACTSDAACIWLRQASSRRARTTSGAGGEKGPCGPRFGWLVIGSFDFDNFKSADWPHFIRRKVFGLFQALERASQIGVCPAPVASRTCEPEAVAFGRVNLILCHFYSPAHLPRGPGPQRYCCDVETVRSMSGTVNYRSSESFERSNLNSTSPPDA